MSALRPRSLSLRAKVVGSYLGVLLIFGTVLGFALIQMARTRANLSNVTSGYLAMGREVDHLTSYPLGYALARDEVAWDRYRASVDRLYLDLMEGHRQAATAYGQEQIARLESPVEIAALLETIAQFDELGLLLRGYRESHDKLQVCLERAEPDCTAVAVAEMRPIRADLTDQIGLLGTKIEIRVQNVLETAGATQMRASQRLLWLSSTAIVLAGVMLLLVHLSLRPIERLIRGTQQIGAGRYEPVEVETHDEIGKLAEAFNRMAGSLAQREKRILQMERLATVGRMAAQVAHEVRNPLNALGLNAEMLGDEIDALPEPHREEARKLLRELQQEIDRLAGVTDTYLSLARLPQPEREPADLRTEVTATLAFLADELAAAGITVTTAFDDDLPELPLDSRQLRQALLNLLRNAREAQPEGGRVHIELSHDDERVALVVEDHGPGVAADRAEAIFDPFLSTRQDGTGLGLAITREIVEGHGGTIRCESATSGGAAFRVELPRPPDDDRT
jgi:two-component system, NtrC family, sensor kinase